LGDFGLKAAISFLINNTYAAAASADCLYIVA